MSGCDDLTLQVANMRPQDAGASIARLPTAAMSKLGLSEGDLVELIGKRHTAALAVRPYPEDEGLNIIRLDGLQRVNAGATSGDHIEIRKADARPATRIVLAPAQKNMVLQGSGDALLRTFMYRPMVAGDVISTSVQQRSRDPQLLQAYGLQEIRLVVVSTQPRGIVQVTEDTAIELRPQFEEPREARRADVTYDDIGGLGSSVEQVREMVELPLRHPELFQRLGIDPPKGVLLHGPPGTGKTSLSLALASRFKLDLYILHIPSIREDSEIEQLFAALPHRCIVLLEDIDAVGISSRKEMRSSLGSDDKDSDDDDDDDSDDDDDKHSSHSRCTLSGLLNVLDGVASPADEILRLHEFLEGVDDA